MPNAASAPTVEVAPRATRVQLFPGYGSWTGRKGAGPYTIADRAHADRIIAATLAAQGSTDLMFDYDHQAVHAPAVAGTAIAAGWFRKLSADDRGVWAEDVEWTAAAAAKIAAREYRYVSPYFLHDKASHITRIINAGLTNVPDFEMQAVAASALASAPGAISAAERVIIDRMGLSDAAYLAARADRDADDMAAAASAATPVVAGKVSPAERIIFERLGLSEQEYLDARGDGPGAPNLAGETFTDADRGLLDQLGVPISAYVLARQDAQMQALSRR